jgi:hypothetical protein
LEELVDVREDVKAVGDGEGSRGGEKVVLDVDDEEGCGHCSDSSDRGAGEL